MRPPVLRRNEVAPCLSTGEGGGAERVSMVSNGRVSIAFAPRCRFLLVAAVLVGGSGCDAISGVGCNVTNTAAPEIAKPLGYDTVDVPLPACATQLPPVRADRECGASEIGKSIDPKDVCHLLGALRRWVASGPADAPSVRPDDWNHVRAVCVRRAVVVELPGYPTEVPPSPAFRRSPLQEAAEYPAQAQPRAPFRRSLLELKADAPNRSHLLVVQMLEESRTLEYSVSPR